MRESSKTTHSTNIFSFWSLLELIILPTFSSDTDLRESLIEEFIVVWTAGCISDPSEHMDRVHKVIIKGFCNALMIFNITLNSLLNGLISVTEFTVFYELASQKQVVSVG